jgi:SHS2 domain-containing protein
MMGSHELADHTADIVLHAHSSDVSDLFAEAAKGLFEVMSDVSDAGGSYRREVRVEADSLENLMHDWLSELLFLHDTEDVLLGGFDVEVDGTALRADVRGEKTDPEKHVLKAEVKAVTYHMLSVRQEEGTWHATVLFDL